jgi:hypothetical protein
VDVGIGPAKLYQSFVAAIGHKGYEFDMVLAEEGMDGVRPLGCDW